MGGGGRILRLDSSSLAMGENLESQRLQNKPIIIAGNGPSLARIDYARLPQEFDVYRCNQFYFEEKYYLGREIKGVFFNPGVFHEQYFTLKTLMERGEYACEEIYCGRMLWGSQEPDNSEFFEMVYPDVREVYKLLADYPKIASFLKGQDLLYRKRATTGVVMLLVAALQGYREMHLIGIDFYESGDYAFEFKKENLLELIPAFKKESKAKIHTKEFDIAVIEMLRECFDLKLYDLSLDSNHPLGLPKSPVVNSSFTLEGKLSGCIDDILIPQVENPLIDIGAIERRDCARQIYKRVMSSFLCRGVGDMVSIFVVILMKLLFIKPKPPKPKRIKGRRSIGSDVAKWQMQEDRNE